MYPKQLKGKKTDLKDSLWLACVCQFGLGTPSYIPPREFRVLRAMTRNRRKQVAERSRARNRVQKLLDRNGLHLGGVLSDIFGANGRRVLDGLADGVPSERILAGLTRHVRPKLGQLAETLAAKLDAESLCQLRDTLDAIRSADERIARQDQRIDAAGGDPDRKVRLLESLPGIDRASACSILAEIGPEPASDFASAKHLGAWAGVCPGNNTSTGKRRSGRARKGNRHLRVTLAECAHGAARTKGAQFHGFHRALAARKGYKRAILATAYKLLRTVYAMLRDDRPYRDPKVDYEHLVVKRNASRWLRMLQKYDLLAEQPNHRSG